VRYAFELAERRPRKSLTLAHKTNVLTYAGDLWQRVVDEVGAEHPAVARSYCHVDAATIYLVNDSRALRRRGDRQTSSGDILTDLPARSPRHRSGGIGELEPGTNRTVDFEPVHGAAHDHRRHRAANPCAAIRSAAMMLEHLGEAEAAKAVTEAVLAQQREMPQRAWCWRRVGSATPWQGGCDAADPDGEDLDGRRARRLGEGDGCTCSPTACTMGPGYSRDPLLTRPLAGRRVPPARAHGAPRPLARLLGIEMPFGVDELVTAVLDTVRASGLAECTCGRSPTRLRGRWVSTRCLARCAWPSPAGPGAATSARRASSGDPPEGQLLDAPRPPRHADGGQGDRDVHQLLAPKVEPCAPATTRRSCAPPTATSPSAPARTSSSSCAARSVAAELAVGALAGITADSVVELAHSQGLEVSEQLMRRSELYLADEAFLTGTAAEVVPITSVDDHVIGTGKPGPITTPWQQAYYAAVRGRDDRFKDWLEYLDESEDRGWVSAERERAGAMELRVSSSPNKGRATSSCWLMARTAEQAGFGAFFRSDHYLSMGDRRGAGSERRLDDPGRPRRDTDRIRLGTSVTSATFGCPARSRSPLPAFDQRAGGASSSHRRRLVRRPSTVPTGSLPPLGERFERLRGAAGGDHRLVGDRAPGRSSPKRAAYELVRQPGAAETPQRPRPPLILGGVGPRRTPALAAR